MRRPGASLGFGLAVYAGLVGAGLVGAGLAAETPVDMAGVSPCAIEVYSIDEDPKGLNVRAAPSGSAAIIATLENSREQDGESFEVEMRVIGSKSGWLLIDRAFFRDYGEADKAGDVFSGKGWVSGSLAAVDVQDVVLRSGPSEGAKVAGAMYSPNSSSPAGKIDRMEVSRIFACNGKWAEVEGTFRRRTLKGWAARLCSNQITVCP